MTVLADTSASMEKTECALAAARVEVQRPVYRTRAFRDKYLKPPEPPLTAMGRLKKKVAGICGSSAAAKRKCLMNLFPCVGILRKYKLKTDLPNDIIAGLTVGIMQLPQGMAYAMLADLPPVVGLYMSFFPVLVYFIFGTSKQISIGTVAVVSLMTGAVVARETGAWKEANGIVSNETSAGNGTDIPGDKWSPEEIDYRIAIAATIGFCAGLAQIGMGILRVGFVTTYMSDSLVSGFTTGAAVHVFTSQVKYVFGISIPRFEGVFQIVQTYIAIIPKLAYTNIPTLVISLICMVILYVVKVHINQRFKSKLKVPVPVELLVVVLSTVASHYGQFPDKWHIKVVGTIPAGLPKPAPPSFVNVSNYGLDCIVIAIIAFAQSISLAVLMAKKHHYDIDANKELIGYGISTFTASFFNCYPCAASVSRSSVQDSAGSRSQVCSIISASLVLIVILFIGPLFRDLPNCALSAVIMVALRSMFLQVLELKTLWKMDKFDFCVWIVTFVCVVILNVDLGLAIGIVFSCFTVVARSQLTKATDLVKLSEVEVFRSGKAYDQAKAERQSDVRVVGLSAPLYYANAPLFLKQLQHVTGAKPEKIAKRQKRLRKRAAAASRTASNSTLVKDEVVMEMDPSKGGDAFNGQVVPNGKSEMVELDPRPFRFLVIDCSGIPFIDPFGIKTLRQIIDDYKGVGITVYLGGVRDEVWRTMENAGFVAAYEDRIFLTPLDAVKACTPESPVFDIAGNLHVTHM